MDVTLYYAKHSGSLVIRILINEIGIKCNYVAVHLNSLMTETGENFLTINPKGTVPTLITKNKLMLTENQVIQQYIVDYCSKYEMSDLLPPTIDFKRYQVLDWLNYINTELHYKHCVILFDKNISKEIKEQVFKPLFIKQLEYVNNKVSSNNFLVNNTFTVADAHLFTILLWLPQFNINLTQFANLEKYFLSLKNRPSIRESLHQKNML